MKAWTANNSLDASGMSVSLIDNLRVPHLFPAASTQPLCVFLFRRKRLIIPNVKAKEVIRLLEEDGWYLARTKGSHRQFKHPNKSGVVTVSGKLSIDVPRGTLNSILKQAGLKERRGDQI